MPDTAIALSMEAAGKCARYDAAAKRILSFKAVIAWILKKACSEFRDYDVAYIMENCIGGVSVSDKAVHQDQGDRNRGLNGDESVEMMNSESSSINEGNMYYDLRFRARVPGGDGDIFLIVNMEIQNQDNPKYALVTRGIYYCARMLSEQYGTVFKNMDYHKMQKVYSIWICPKPEGKREDTIIRYSLREDEVRGNSFIHVSDYDKMEVVVISLVEDYDSSEDPLVGLLSVLLSSSMALERRKEILGSRYGIAMDKELEEEVIEMCNLSKAVEDIGRRKGIEEGRREGFLMSLFQLVDEGDLTLEKAAKKAGMTIEDFLEKKREYNK